MTGLDLSLLQGVTQMDQTLHEDDSDSTGHLKQCYVSIQRQPGYSQLCF